VNSSRKRNGACTSMRSVLLLARVMPIQAHSLLVVAVLMLSRAVAGLMQ
jgi:hypothetical protein